MVPHMMQGGLGLLLLSMVFFLAGFCSNMWIRSSEYGFNFGLWAMCHDGDACVAYDVADSNDLHVARGGGIAQILFVALSTASLLYFMARTDKAGYAYVAYRFAFIAGIVGFVVSVYFVIMETVSTDNVSVGWSAVLVILSSVMDIAAWLLIRTSFFGGQWEYTQPLLASA